MKSRRLILTLECVTTYTLAEIRAALTHVALSHGRWITRYPDNEDDGMPNRIVQVRCEVAKPEPKLSKADREWGDAVIADAAERPKRFRSAKEAFEHYAEPARSGAVERHMDFIRNRKPGESFRVYRRRTAKRAKGAK